MRVAAVIAHPDDDVLGCGGTLARYADDGHEVRVLLPLRRSDPRGVAHWDELVAHFRAAADILGVQPVLGEPMMAEADADTDVRTLHDHVLPTVEWAETVFTHWPGDVHQVHRSVSRAVEIATRPFRRRRDLNLFEVPTSTDQALGQSFAPQLYVSLDKAQVDRKLAAMAVYSTEGAPGRNPEDLERKLRVRGAEIGTTWAETFVVARQFR